MPDYFTPYRFNLIAAYYKIEHIILFGKRQRQGKKTDREKKAERNRDTKQQKDKQLKRERQQAHSKEEEGHLGWAAGPLVFCFLRLSQISRAADRPCLVQCNP